MSETNEQLGIVSFEEALDRASAANLDLVELASKGEHPVVRIMDYGKYLYQESRRQREARKNQVQQKVKEVKLHPGTDTNDFETKARQAIEFLRKGDKVKVIMQFRGREMAHQDIGERLLLEMLEKLSEVCVVDAAPKLMGRQIMATVSPKVSKASKGGAGKQSAPSKNDSEAGQR